jgi:phage terminase large subunit
MATPAAKINPIALDRMVRTAKTSGIPKDSLERFLRYGYVPQPMQMRFHAAARECDKPDGPTEIGVGGARGPGKSHAIFAQVALDDCQRVPGLKFLYLRKISKNDREQLDDLRRAVLRHIPHDYNRSAGVLTFENQSRIILGHFSRESDIDQYLGLEYDGIVVEEATSLTLAKYRALSDSNRTSKPDWRPRIYSSTNPGNIGHGWYKALFIKPARDGKETSTRFIFGTVDDNKFINPEYTANLEKNVGWKLRAYRFGDWDIAAGQFFSTWRHDAIVKPWFKVSEFAHVWASLDYGFTHPTAVYLFTEFDGKRIILDEYVAAKKLPSQNAEGIKAMLARNGVTIERLWAFVAGDDVFSNKGDSQGKTIAKQYDECGIHLVRANMDRINGAGELLQALGDPDNGIAPTLEISERCVKLIECIPALQHDPHRPEDVLKVDIDEDGNGGDDPYDSARYGLMKKRKEARIF